MKALRGLAGTIVVAGFTFLSPMTPLWGDGLEYAATLLAWINHASPDIRAEDLAPVAAIVTRFGYDALHPNMVAIAADGTQYAAHFWLYPLLCAPAALLLHRFGYDPLLAFSATNTMLFVALAAAALWSARLSTRDRDMVALAAVTPVVLHLRFAHPEVFTWACVVASLLAINHGRYVIAAVAAGCGAMQNPPVTSLAAFSVVLAVKDYGWRGGARTAAAAALCLLPPLFYLLATGQPAPLVRAAFVDWHLATPARAWSMLTDLDQGLLPYVPGVVALALVNIRHARGLRSFGMLGVLTLFIAGAATSHNWNSALAGMMRYAVWVTPLLAWMATEPRIPVRRGWVVLALALHAALLAMPAPTQETHSRLARYALERWPSWYYSDPEIFGERASGLDWLWRDRLPLAVAREDGSVSKILADAESLARLDRVFIVDAAYRDRVAAERSSLSGMFYMTPPPGAVHARCQPDTVATAALLEGVRIHARWPDAITGRRVAVQVDVANHGAHPICNLGAGGTAPFNLTARIRDDQRSLTDDAQRIRGPQVLVPGELSQQMITVVLPAHDGRYTVELLPVIEGVGWGESGARFVAHVSAADGHYTAVVAPHS